MPDDPVRKYRPDNPFAQQAGGAARYRPDNPFAEQPATEPMRAAPIRARPPEPRPSFGPAQRAPTDVSFARPTPVAPPPLPEPTPETTVAAAPRAPTVPRYRQEMGDPVGPVPQPVTRPSIGAAPERGFMQRLLDATRESIGENYRTKSAAPGAPSALPRPEREMERQAEQVRIYGEAAGKTPQQIAQETTQDLVDLQANEATWAQQLGLIIADFADPAALAGGIAAERAAVTAIQSAAKRGIPWAMRVARLSQTPAGAPLVRRLVARATHGVSTGGAANVGFQAVADAEEGRLPTPGELAYTFAVGTALTPALEGTGALAAAPFRAGRRLVTPQPARSHAGEAGAAGPVQADPAAPASSIRQRLADAIYPEGADRRARAQRDAETDALTGLGNQRAFERAQAGIGEVDEVVAFDLNNLKAVNDVLGHEAGNDLIRRAGAAISEAGGRGFRPGGDELIAIVARGEGQTVRRMVEQAVGETPVQLPDGRTVQASISGSVGPDFTTADAGLQAAKQARKGAAGSARGPGGETPSTIVRMPVAEIQADPARFQFKSVGAEGVSSELKGITRFNEQAAGIVSVWRDPANGVTYVINGHHRLELAKRLGHPALNVQFINAPDAVTARAEGAYLNMAEGRGTATDVAKFLRDMKQTPADLEARGVTLRGDLTRDGLALAQLAPDLFDQVATAQMPQGWGVAIGSMIDDHVLQRQAVQAVRASGKRLTQAEVREVARQVRDAGTEGVNQETLFGTEQERHGVFIHRAQIAAALKKRLAGDKRLFGYVAKEGRAEELSRAGGTQIDVDAARGIAEGSARSEEVFDRLYTRSGPIATLIDEGARRLARGEKTSTVLADIYPAIGEAVGREIEAGTGRGARPDVGERPVSEEPRSLADEVAGAGEEGRVETSQDPDQAGMFSPARRDDYGGEHSPPGPDSGAPLHDLTGAGSVYPDDVYSQNAVRYYGTGDEALDRQSFAIAQSIRGRPNARVTIYRAVPDDITLAEKIAKIERQKAHILRRGKLPPNVETNLSASAYYGKISADLERLRAGPAGDEGRATINAGDWVTINRAYAKDHGEGALRGNYRIISKTVRARDLFTNGDSIHEWGYWPEGAMEEPLASPSRPSRAQELRPSESFADAAARELETDPRYADMARRASEGSPLWLPSQGPRGVDLRLMDDLAVRRLYDDITSIPPEQFADMPAEWRADRAALEAELKRRGLREARQRVEVRDVAEEDAAPLLEAADIVRGREVEYRGRPYRVEGLEYGPSNSISVTLRDESGNMVESFVGDPALRPSKPRLARPELRLTEEGSEQGALFSERVGTAASRSLAQTEAAARSEIEVLRQRFIAEKDPKKKSALARDIAERQKLLNRGGAISADEMATRAAAEEPDGPIDAGPDQLAMLSPDMPAGLKAKVQQMGGTVPTAAQQAEVRTLMEISRKLAAAVGVPLNQGRFRAGLRKAAGVFFPFKETTRVVRFDALDTVAHEVGHFLSKKYLKNPTMRSANFRGAGRQPVMLPKEAVRELTQMGRDLYGSRKPAGGYGEEGIAEWVSFYVTDPTTLAQKAPTFTAWMDDLLTREPMLRAALDQARASFELYQKVPAAARFDTQISVAERPRMSPTVRDYMRVVADDTYDIRAAVEELGKPSFPSRDAGILARLSRGAWGETMEWLERGVRELGTADKRMGEGIVPKLTRLIRSGRAQDLRRYLVAESTLERIGHGHKQALTAEDAAAIVEHYKGDKEVIAAAEAIWAHGETLLRLRRDVGLLTDLQYQQIKKANQRRVGFYRIFEPDETAAPKGFGGRGGLGSSGVKAQHGSARRQIDPIEAVMRDTYVTAKKVREHQAKRALVEQSLATEGGGRVVEEVPAPQRVTNVSLEKVQQQLRELGLVYEATDAKTGERFTVELGGPGGAELEGILRAFQDAHVAGGTEAKDLVFPMLIKGDLRWFQARDKALYDALVGLGPVELDLWRRVMSAPKRLLQTGATTTFEFGLGNIGRDVVAQSVFSRASWRPPLWRHVEGLYHILKKDPVYQRYRLHGTDQASMGASDRGTTQLEMRRLFGYFRTLKQAWLDRKQAWGRATPVEKGLFALNDLERVVLSPFEAIRTVKEMSETMGRVGEFAAVERQALKRGVSPVDASTEAALAGRDVGIDFQQLGSATREVNHLVAFFGAWLRGWAQLGRELKARPHVVVPRLVAEVTVPSLALYYLQRDDPVYRDMPSWKRDLFWVYVDRGDDRGVGWDGYGSGKVEHIWMFPKPFELGFLFGTLPERLAAWHDQRDPDLAKNMASLVRRMAPPHIPTAAVPLIENFGNRSTFRDRPIVPRSREKLDPGEQYAPQTGEAARLLGRAIGFSPAKIENLVRGYTGGAGMYAVSGANWIVRVARDAEGLPPLKTPMPESEDALLDIPGIRRFVSRIPAEDAESVERLYQDYAAAERRRQTWRALLKEGRRSEASAYLDEHRDEILSVASEEEMGEGKRGPLREAYLRMQELQQLKRQVQQAGVPGGRERAVEAIRRLGGTMQEREP